MRYSNVQAAGASGPMLICLMAFRASPVLRMQGAAGPIDPAVCAYKSWALLAEASPVCMQVVGADRISLMVPMEALPQFQSALDACLQQFLALQPRSI